MDLMKKTTFTVALLIAGLACVLLGMTGGVTAWAHAISIPAGWPRVLLLSLGLAGIGLAVFLELRVIGVIKVRSNRAEVTTDAKSAGGPCLYLERRKIRWADHSHEVQRRYWACGTSLVAVAESQLIPMYCSRSADVRVILPKTNKLFASYEQLAQYDQSGWGPATNQVKLARECYEKFAKLKNLPNGVRIEDIVRQYGGIMFANITIFDEDAFIAFYDSTGIGEYSFALHCSAKTAPLGYKQIEDEFLRMWGATHEFGAKLAERV